MITINFVNTFTFYEENNLVEIIAIESNISYKLNDSNILSFKTRENKKDNLTEFYNLIYEYKKDCLTASINTTKNTILEEV